MRNHLSNVQRIVIKVGTSTLTYSNGQLNIERIEQLVRQIANLKNKGYDIVLVSSGAVGAGITSLKGIEYPIKSIPIKQAAAAIGQVALTHMYKKLFSEYNIGVGQILLTQSDIDDRKRYLNARDAFFTLLNHNIIPIVNENDAVVTDEIKVGDNDTLSALVTNLIEAELLILLSDIDGLYDKNPHKYPSAKLISVVNQVTSELNEYAKGKGTSRGTGGMITKLKAAKIVTNYGAKMIIANGSSLNIINDIINKKEVGTLFLPQDNGLSAKDQWIKFNVQPAGKVIIDSGAVNALKSNSSLLAVGITKIVGDFSRGDIVLILDCENNEMAKGVINYNSKELSQIIGKHSKDIEKILGYKDYDEVIHVNNMVKEL